MKKGFSIIEIIVAVALFVIFSSGAVISVIQGFNLNRLGEEETIANQFAAEGLEAARSIRNQSFASLINSAGTGIVRSSGVWTFSGSNNVLNKYTRVLTVSDAQRDGSGNVVSSGGTVDSLTKKVVSTVTWNFSASRPETTTLTTYLTDWEKAFLGNRANPAIESVEDITGNVDGIKIAISGNYAYIVRNSGTANFAVVDISNTANPSTVATLNLSGNLSGIAVSGNFAYVSSDANASELQIVNITNPLSPALAGSYDAAGTANGNEVFAIGTTVYLVRGNSTDPEFMIINASVPATPTLTGSLNLVGSELGIFVSGTHAYIGSDSDTAELQVLDISTPALPVLTGTLNLSGSNNTTAITGFSNIIVLGRNNGELDQINVSNSALPSLLGSYSAGTQINDISLGNGNTYAFIGTNATTGEFKVIDITNPVSMTLVGSLDLNPAQNLSGVYYDSSRDRAFAVGSLDSQELIIFMPQ